MQIFSKLQRNSVNQIFIKIFIVFIINFFSSYSVFFPIMLGFFVICEELFYSALFLGFVIVLHNFDALYFIAGFVFIKFFLLRRIINSIDLHYQDVVSLFSVYFLLLLYLVFFTKLGVFKLFLYIVYNFSFDLIIMRFIRCEVKLY
jgi:hypothetical protein